MSKAKYFLKDIDFSGEGAHLAYTLGTGAASKLNDVILMKTDDLELTEEAAEYIAKFKEEVSTEEVVQDTVVVEDTISEVEKASGEKPELKEENEASRLDNVIEKSKEDNMTQEANNVEKVEIDKAALSDLQKAMEQMQKAAEEKDAVIKSLQAKEEARDLQDVVKACDAFVAVEAKEELAKALFAVQKAGMGEESATIFKALNEIQKAAQEALEKEAGVEGSDEATVEEVSENDLLKAAIASMKGE